MPEDIQAGPAPTPVIELDEVDSTNVEAMRHAAGGERGPLWLTARRQTSGRGRSGRSWSSLDGNLMATLLVVPDVPPARLGQLALVAGVAAHQSIADPAISPVPPQGLRLKWPNDILINDAKLGGILVESTTFGGVTIAAVGFGINIATAPVVPGRLTTSLAAHGAAPSRDRLLSVLDRNMMRWLDVLRADAGLDGIRQAWLGRAGPPGEITTVNTGAAIVSGAFVGLDDDGALLVREGGGVRKFAFGDVTVAAESSRSE